MGDMEGLFDGPASGLPASLSSKTALYRPAPEDEAPVKHLAGYAPFMVFCQSSGVPAENLAIDLVSLLAFLRTNVDLILRDPQATRCCHHFRRERHCVDAPGSTLEGHGGRIPRSR